MILVVVCLGLAILNLCLKRNRCVFLVSLAMMWFIMTFVTGNADEDLYMSRYNNASEWKFQTELIFQLMNTVCYKLGLSFIQYKGIISFIILSLVGSSVWTLSRYPNLVLILYFVYPFPMNIAQLRFALASAIFIFSYRYMFENNSQNKRLSQKYLIKNDIKFMVCVILASLVHSVALIWGVVIVLKRMSVKLAVWLTSLFSLFVYFVFNPNSISWILRQIGAYARISAYFSTAYQNSSWRHYGTSSVGIVFICILTILMCVVCRRKKSHYSVENISTLLKIDIFSLSLLAFVLRYTSEMYRPQEGIMLLNYIVLTNEIEKKNLLRINGQRRDVILQMLLLVLVIGSFTIKIFLFNKETVWIPMFFNNMYLGCLCR